jgi:hypothetical protein
MTMKTGSILLIPALATALVAHASDAHANIVYSSEPLTIGKSFGDSDWGAGYSGGAKFTYDRGTAVSTNDDTLAGDGSLTAWARVFGTKREIIEVRGDLYGSNGNPATFGVDAYVLGQAVYSNEFAAEVSYSKLWSQTFFTVSQWFTVGPVPVRVSASAKGYAGFDIWGQLDVNSIDLTFRPRLSLGAKAFAGVDIAFASAGIYGELNILRASLPIEADIRHANVNACTPSPLTLGPAVKWDLDIELDLESLDGELGVEATLLSDTWRKRIVKWNGLDETYDLVTELGSVCL